MDIADWPVHVTDVDPYYLGYFKMLWETGSKG